MKVAGSTTISIALLVSTLMGISVDGASKEVVFPSTVVDTEGERIDVARLAREREIVIVTLKATWCPICREQLVRLKGKLARINTARVAFLVLAPGPVEELREVKDDTGFPYPFIADEDLRIARALGLGMGTDQIVPALLILDRDRVVRWMQSGRNSIYYGDDELLEEIGLGILL